MSYDLSSPLTQAENSGVFVELDSTCSFAETTGVLSGDTGSSYVGNSDLSTGEQVRYGKSSDRLPSPSGHLDKKILNRVSDLIETLQEESDPLTYDITYQSLRINVTSLWESAATASEFHQDILAVLEAGLLSIDEPGGDHLDAFREAVLDLESDPITQAHVNVIRRRFMDCGINPLAMLADEEG